MAAREEEPGGEQPGTEQISQGRRRLLAALAAAGGGGALLTQQWAKPIVDLVVVPLHAQGSIQCPTTGTFSCAGITFTASALMTVSPVNIECKGGPALTACCTEVVWKKGTGTNQAQLTISHDAGRTLKVYVDYFTKNTVGCTNSSSFHTFDPMASGVTYMWTGDISGDTPECTGFRINKVEESNGTAIAACTNSCTGPVEDIAGDLHLYVQLVPSDGTCPA